MAFSIVHSLEATNWYRFLDTVPQANIFHTPEMFQVFQQAHRYQPKLWAVQNEIGQLLALFLPVEVFLGPGPMRLLTTRSVAYGGLLYHPSSTGLQALDFLLQRYTDQVKTPALFTELRHLVDAEAAQTVLQQHRFFYEPHLNFLVPLDRSSDEILQNIGRRTRKQIRRGLNKKMVSIEEVTEAAQFPAWYEILQKTYASAQVPLADVSLFETAFKVLQPRGMVKFLLARVEDQYAAASVELLYRDVIYGWYGGTDRAFSKYYPTELLHWYIFEWGAKHQYRMYDFGGAGSPDEDYGVRDFKAKFGGDLVCFGRHTYQHAPYRLQLSKWAYALYRKLI